MLLTLLLSAQTSLGVGAADVNAILASAAAGSENIYGTGQCAAPRVTGAAARDRNWSWTGAISDTSMQWSLLMSRRACSC